MAKNLEKLKSLVESLEDFTSGDPLTRKQFNGEIKKIAEYIANLKQTYTTQIAGLSKKLEVKLAEIDQNNTKGNDLNKNELKALVGQLESFKKVLEATTIRKLAQIKDGKDADEDLIVDRATERVKKEFFIPTTEDLLNEVPSLAERIRDSLELLQDEDRLDVSAIKGIEELLTQIDKDIKKAIGAIHVPSPIQWTKHESFAGDGSTTEFTLAAAPIHNGKAAIVRYEGQVLAETTHYSISGTKLTLTFVPNDGTEINITYW